METPVTFWGTGVPETHFGTHRAKSVVMMSVCLENRKGHGGRWARESFDLPSCQRWGVCMSGLLPKERGSATPASGQNVSVLLVFREMQFKNF